MLNVLSAGRSSHDLRSEQVASGGTEPGPYCLVESRHESEGTAGFRLFNT